MDKMNSILNSLSSINLSTVSLKQIIDALIAIAIIIFFYIFSSNMSYIFIRIFKRKKEDKPRIKEMPFYKPLQVFFTVLGIYIAANLLPLGTNLMQNITKAFKIIVSIVIAQAVGSSLSTEHKTIQKIQNKFNVNVDDNRMNFFYKVLRAVIWIIDILYILTVLGVNIKSLIAGIGVGGVILTLAAQDTAKSLFAGVMLVLDKQFKIGDWIQTKSYQGIVEDITFRTTRIRTFDDTVANIPNSILSQESIVNWSEMSKRRYNFRLEFPYDTSADEMQRLCSKIYFMLINHPKIVHDDVIVKFDKISDLGLSVLINLFTKPTNYNQYMNIKEEINKNIIKILDQEGVNLASPTSVIQVDPSTIKSFQELYARNEYLKNEFENEDFKTLNNSDKSLDKSNNLKKSNSAK